MTDNNVINLLPPRSLKGLLPEQQLAKAIFDLTLDDARRQARGLPVNQRLGGDKERRIEIIGEAQWWCLDDPSEDEGGSFAWCCWAMELDVAAARKRIQHLLTVEEVILPRSERHRLAELAGKRRLDLMIKKSRSQQRPLCADRACSRYAVKGKKLCRVCLDPIDKPALICSKCGKKNVKRYSTHTRKLYCPKCMTICIRKGCSNQRRPGRRASTCRYHHRLYRQAIQRKEALYVYKT